ncbi:MAG: RtcB family protein, partial [Phycisphaerae bacterium]
MKRRELNNMGIPYGPAMSVASRLADEAVQGGVMKKPALKTQLKRVASEPDKYTDDDTFGELARTLLRARKAREDYTPRGQPAPCKVFGKGLDPAALEQIDNACRLPISVRAALMPDAHKGYGLPIGGVLATEGAVIPYAVGVDIACRMKMTVLDLPVSALDDQQDRLINALQRETSFGVGSEFKAGRRRQHPVMDEDWSFSPAVARLKDKAWAQLGTSGSGNHFAEYGLLTLEEPELGLEAGQYLALLSHSGSRGTGAEIANHFSKVAKNAHPELPKELRHLSW